MLLFPQLVESKGLGMRYMGRKQSMAYSLMETMLSAVPNARYFIDIFGGGASMSFYALECGFSEVVYNDLDRDLHILFNTLKQNNNGNLPKEFYDFISHADYNAMKHNKDENLWRIIGKYCYSFGDGCRQYYAGKEIELLDYHKHILLIDFNTEGLDYLCSLYKPFIEKYIRLFDNSPSIALEIRNDNLLDILNKANILSFLENDDDLLKDNPSFMDIFLDIKQSEVLEYVKRYAECDWTRNEKINTFRPLLRVLQLKQLAISNYLNDDRLTMINKPYDEIDLSMFPSDETIIYLDPPYKDCSKDYAIGRFDFDKFEAWIAKNKDKNIFISEFDGAYDYPIIWSKERRNTFAEVSARINHMHTEVLYKP